MSENQSNSVLEKAIECMTNSGVCTDSHHYHSFVGVSYILLPVYKCVCCGERLKTDVFGSTLRPPVRCIACGIYAHRDCVFSDSICRPTIIPLLKKSASFSARLLPSRRSSEHSFLTVRKCKTWNGIDAVDWTNQELEVSKSLDVEVDNFDKHKQNTSPLHFASHGSKVISQALQENISISFNRLMPKENDSASSVRKNSTSVANRSRNNEILLETSGPKPHPVVIRKDLPLFTLAGSIVGGFVGVACAGPVGGVIGVKCGQLASLGVLLEGSLTASFLASGITVGIAAGNHLQERIDKARVITLGEGTQRRILLIRPSIQIPEQIWLNIYQEARQIYPGNGLVRRLIPNEANAAKRERYDREVDIIEAEMPFADKIILLVSRILNNKDSLPGHVYRELIDAFRCRALNLHHDEDQIKGDQNLNRQRRNDSHALIKMITTALLEDRAGFGSSSTIIQLAASAVESLVFAEIYGLVMEEIEMEYEHQDNELLEKNAIFELIGLDNYSGYKSCISEAALEALHCLPQAHSAVDKLQCCVAFLEKISEHFSNTESGSVMGADSLLMMVCQHILVAKVFKINSQIAFLEEYASNEHLLRGREGYALVTLQASLYFLNSSTDFTEIFFQDEL